MSSKDKLIHELNVCIGDLLTEAGVPGYTSDEQRRINLQAKALRDRRMRLRKMEFDHRTAGYIDALSGINAVTDEMDVSVDRINDLNAFFGAVAKLVAAIDRIIGAATLAA